MLLRILVAVLGLTWACPWSCMADDTPASCSGRDVVVTVSKLASDAGLQVLNEGGSAVDAAVTVALVLQVTWPEAGNIGGGGFMMVHPQTGQEPVFIDYREKAPASATRTMFGPDDSTRHAKAVGVPGTLRGLQLAHQKFGRLPWKQLVLPAIKLAEEGFPVDAGLVRSLNSGLRNTAESFTEFHRLYGAPHGSEWKLGDILKQPDLAKTMRLIAEHGPDAFYQGEIADLLLKEMQQSGGIISKQDLMNYQAKERLPVKIPFRGHDVYAPSLPSSGGITLALMLNMWEQSSVKDAPRWSAASVHYRAEVMRRAYLERAKFLGDSDYVSIPNSLVTPEYAAKLTSTIDLNKATSSVSLAPEGMLVRNESESTTHFSIIDRNGMAVSNTYTLEESFGSRVVVRGAGFLLNNEMGDFNWFPGETTRFGRIGTKANQISPGKRMLSSMTPVLVLKEGKTVLVTGSPGGRTIINTVFCVLLNSLAFDLSPEESVREPRFHHQWMPDQIQIEKRVEKLNPTLVSELERRGHTVSLRGSQGDAHTIQVMNNADGESIGVADLRLSGAAVGK
ncbi:gamma-glutamyltransferase [Planctomicrobium sp. SH527]|uniref:gamma-glutamyltransferase n=1 Tax=Planctomicrobium sp. SH527 TaxID=3448123 RepID=UPI003F5BF56D